LVLWWCRREQFTGLFFFAKKPEVVGGGGFAVGRAAIISDR
jgi:hypothetical protein